MYIVTGGAGFIGSAFVWKLNQEGIHNILIVDDLAESPKWKNLRPLKYSDYLHKETFMDYLLSDDFHYNVRAIIHMGACSSTTETNVDYLFENNYRYTQLLAEWAIKNNVRFIYASSAATYGDGELGYDDDSRKLGDLRPMNPYGYSKHVFDLWALRSDAIKSIVGLKFFNVFGPNEYHKGEMRSVVHKAYEQIRDTGKVQLFKSYRHDYQDGEQKRDFIYIKDCVDVLWWLCQHPDTNGIFNLGSGRARTWNDLARAVFAAMNKEVRIRYIDMPEMIRDKYQYFTEAALTQWRRYECPFEVRSLEEGISDYVRGYLQTQCPYLGEAHDTAVHQ